jgi:hypothetical protein
MTFEENNLIASCMLLTQRPFEELPFEIPENMLNGRPVSIRRGAHEL